MKKSLALLLAMGLTVSSFGMTVYADNEGETVQETEAAYSRMDVKYTDAFSVEYLENGVKLITDAENQRFLMVPDGVEVPEGYDDAYIFQGEIKKALFCSSTEVGMVAPLNVWDRIVGVTQESDWPFEEMTKGLEDGSITFVGSSNEPDFETIQALDPDIVFLYTGKSAQTNIVEKMEELGIPYAVDNEYMEEDYMGRMEWTKFLGSFFNKDEEAVAYVEQQEKAIEEMKETVKDADRPKVAWGMVSNGMVYVPNGGSYVAKEIDAAGGDYIFKDMEPDTTSSSQLTLEEFYAKLTEADIWIYSSNKNYVPDYAALSEKMPLAGDAKAVAEKHVWQLSPDFYYRTDATEQQVIDLAKIFHPDLYENAEIEHYNALAE